MPNNAGFILFRRNRRRGVEFLLLRSRFNGQHWSFPKGHIDKDESPLKAAVRELQEETGIEQGQVVLCDYETEFVQELQRPTKKCPTGVKSSRLFLAQVQDGVDVKLSHEHFSFRWCSIFTALTLLGRRYDTLLHEALAVALAS
jgi:8-oxo-dGTP pyrophosphatase MutT (NUDIX family)